MKAQREPDVTKAPYSAKVIGRNSLQFVSDNNGLLFC